jgi:MoxR-like ATPase
MSDRHRFMAVMPGDGPVSLVEPLVAHSPDPARYRPTRGLAEAMDTAMLLGMPLLLTGEPGTGKTQAARWLAHQLRARFVRQDVKSTTTGRDLLYQFDEVARFREANRGESRRLIDYVRFSALGEAIIRTWGGAAPLSPLRRGGAIEREAFTTSLAKPMLKSPPFGAASAPAADDPAVRPQTALLLPRDPDFAAAAPEHCVVLIDEIDKAPRDTPNDLLAEFEALAFDVPELGVRIAADTRWRPVVIMTSNSERSLPEAFLRRCLYFNIPAPDEQDMAEIVGGLIRDLPGTPLFRSAFAFYDALRREPTIRKKPGTAEFLAWNNALLRQAKRDPNSPIAPQSDADGQVRNTLICLAKAGEDQALAERLFASGEWQVATPHPTMA